MIRVKVASGLSGFFAPHITGNLETTGAVGGGFGIDGAISVELSIDLDHRGLDLVNRINGTEVESRLARYIVERIMAISGAKSGKIVVEQKISVPVGGGYGTSGGSAVAIAFALAKALNTPLDFYTIAEIAHEADIVCKSGLGTVVGIIKPCNGITLVVKPGGPKHAEVVCIPVDASLLALTAFYRPIPKSSILSSQRDLERAREVGLETLKKIERNPTPEIFMENCYTFASEIKIMTPLIRHSIELLKRVEGVIGASMNMVGEAIFALVDKGAVDRALSVLAGTNPRWLYVWRPGSSGINVEQMALAKYAKAL